MRKAYNYFRSIFINKYFLKFAVTGALATILNYGIFFMLYTLLGINYLISSSVGYVSGLILGFFINKRWSFESDTKDYLPEIIKYFIVYLTSLGLGLLLLHTEVAILGINPLIANVAMICFTTIMNFLGSRYFVFQKFRKKYFNFIIYRYRFLINYIIIGFGSILLEVLIILLLKQFISINIIYISIFGFLAGVLFSYNLNSRLNFKVPKDRGARTFRIFVIISFLSYGLNLLVYEFLGQFLHYEYYYLRFLTAAIVFVVSYSLHRRFTFIDIKYVGVAVYLSKKENIGKIWEKIRDYPDFMHIDLIDKSYNPNAESIDLDKGKEIKEKWLGIKTMTHIMSKKPSQYIDKVKDFSDIIIIHYEIDEDVDKVIELIRKNKRDPGIALKYTTPLKSIERYLKKVKVVQILGIEHPGIPGQYLQKNAIKRLETLNHLKKRYSFDICFDGGVKRENIDSIHARYVVSASSILKADSPTDAIFDLKTSSRYYAKDISLKNTIRKKILDIGKNIPFIKSLSIVGSFVDKDDVSGISDVDVVIIVDVLTSEKYHELLGYFESLKSVIETDYGLKVKINDTFGPLKFDDKFDVVFHVMIYDVKGHISHIIKSPFTVYDWERSNVYAKLHMTKIMKTPLPQHSQLISSRRSVESYMSDLRQKSITYRKYSFAKENITQIELKKDMQDKDRLEYMYHIMRFLIVNFMKVYKKQNAPFSKELLKEFFETTGMDAAHINFFYKISKRKLEQKETVKKKDILKLQKFLHEFIDMHNKVFFKESKKIIFVRHQETALNKPGIFIGQKTDVGILPNMHHEKLLRLQALANDCGMVYTSQMRRAIETSKEIVKGSDGEIIINSLLNEIDYGDAEGKDAAYLAENYPSIVDQWSKHKDPRFPNGENYEDVLHRVHKFMNICHAKPYARVMAVTHNVAIRVIIGSILDIPKHLWHKIPTEHLGSYEVILTKNNQRYINISKELLESIYSEVYN